MTDVIPAEPHRHTMERLEAAKRITSDGVEYWMARELGPILGYDGWRDFEAVMKRAADALTANGLDPSHQIVPTRKLMEVGKGATNEGRDFFVTRAASYLIAMNGAPSKPEIAAAQIYFAVKTRQMEVHDRDAADRKRIDARDKVTKAFKLVSGVAQDAGVQSKMQAVFHGARFQGLYEMSRAEVAAAKGLSDNENLLDRAGALELSMHEFQMNLAADVIGKERIQGQQRAIERNRDIAREVRQAVIKSHARLPEHLPLEPEPVGTVRRRLNAAQKKLAKASKTTS